MRTKLFYLLSLVAIGFSLPASAADTLSLDEYLGQVRSGNGSVKASLQLSDGAKDRAAEADLVVSPGFFASAGRSIDGKPNPFLNYRKLNTNAYSLGFSKTTRFGLDAKLSYNLTDSEYIGLPPLMGPNPPNFFEGRPQVEFTQSLWRNFFGSETRAKQAGLEAQAKVDQYAESFKAKLQLAEAEATYWRLALSRENVQIQKDATSRAQKLFDWSSKRVRLHLADSGDALQAEAALFARQLQLQSAIDEERAASRAFNLGRGISSDVVKDHLHSIDTDLIAKLTVPAKSELRDDVRAAEAGARGAEIRADLAIERETPVVDVFSTLAFNSRDEKLSKAFHRSLTTDRPSILFGVKFTAPLDFGAISAAKSGYLKERAAADLAYQKKVMDQESEWSDLSAKFNEAKTHLMLAQRIEDAQQKKLLNERDRLTKGRSTTYQVLLFEQDYSVAQLSRIQAEAEILNLVARMKTFRSES